MRRLWRTVFRLSRGGEEPPVISRRGAKNGVTLGEPLHEGDIVRVRSLEQIRETLDANGGCHGCAFLEPMARYCGQELRVAKCLQRFFDEKRWRMLKCRNVVLLEGAFCDGSGHPDTLGCDRMCLFFWRIEWLESSAGRPFEGVTV